MDKKKKFETTTKGCKEAQEYLKEIGSWTPRIEQMDGFSQVHYANKLYNQPKSKKK
jgi:hypothetical protein